jgi:hypothetical protein
MSRETKHLLPGYATDSLGDDERRELLRAALDDQELFDRLVEEEELRELLQDPAARQELLAVLEQPTLWQRLRAWFEREATLLDLAAVGAVVVAAIVGFGVLAVRPRPGTPEAAARPMGTPLSPLHVAALLTMPENQAVPAGIEITNRPDALFAPGETLRLRLTLRAPARVVLLAQPPDGPPRQVWPGLGQPPALVPRPSSGGPAQPHVELEAPDTPGTHRLRMVVVPAELDMGAVSANALGARPAALTLVDLRYAVAGPRNDREPAHLRGAKAAAALPRPTIPGQAKPR